MLRKKTKILIALLAAFLVIAGCSSQSDELNNPEADLGVQISMPQKFAQSSIEAITDDLTIDNIEATATNQNSGEEKEVITDEINDETSLKFDSLTLGDNYNLDVTANDGEYDIYQGDVEVVSLEQDQTVDVELDLSPAKGLVVNFDQDLAEGDVLLLNLDDDIETDIAGDQAEFDELPANSYDIRINTDGSEATGQIDVKPGRMTYTEAIELDDDLGEIEVYHQTPPPAPIDFEVKADGEDRIDLSWSGEEDNYYLYRSEDSNSRERITEVDSDSYTDDNLDSGTTYHYWVRAVNDDGVTGSFSDREEATTDGESPGPGPDIENYNELRTYQVMVSSFQSGDEDLGYGRGYGPGGSELDNGDFYHDGDLVGIKEAIPYIADLGMNSIWMTPIFHTFSEDDYEHDNFDGWTNALGDDRLTSTGYYTNDFFSVDPQFGDEEILEDLIEKANDHGLYVILDGVFGHHNDRDGISDSPSEHSVSGSHDPVDYPQSLEFFKEVATYWIEEYGIDGWRLDQAYQVAEYDQDRNYWPDIREAVEEAAEETDTLGYMVGEIWDGRGDEIRDYGYAAGDGEIALNSNYDFPMRYKMVQVMATQEETGDPWANNQPASELDAGFSTDDKEIEGIDNDDIYPNLMLTNHDLVRFGTLIERAPHLGYGKDNPDYWRRHEMAMSFLAAYTGPITLYYGDEIGDDIPGYVHEDDQEYYDDNASRTAGQIEDFDDDQQDLHDYVQSLMELRDENPALWNGERENLIAEDGNGNQGTRYADLKTCPDTGDRMLYVLNVGAGDEEDEGDETFSFTEDDLGGSQGYGIQLEDALTGQTVDISDIEVERLSARFFHVTDTD